MQKIMFFLSCLAFINYGYSQSSNMEFDYIKFGDNQHLLIGLDLSPNGQLLAISSLRGRPLIVYDWSKREIIKRFNVGDWYGGSSVKYSPKGKYLLLQKLFYNDAAINKDNEVDFELIDAASGSLLKLFNNYHSIAFAPDAKYVVSLSGEEIAFWNLNTVKKEKAIIVTKASNSFAISPDGKYIAVSHHLDEGELKRNPKYKKDKKALKHALKYKQQISVYDIETSKKEYTVNEFYDIIYRLEYSEDGKTLFCLQIPHVKEHKNRKRQIFISTINGVTGESARKGFVSQAIYEPDFKLSHDGKLFGLVSHGGRSVELHIYDFETASMLYRFELASKMFERVDGELVGADSRAAFVFLPDNEKIVITQGNRLVFWDYKAGNQ